MKHSDEYTTDSDSLGCELTVGFTVTFDSSGEFVWKTDGAYSWLIEDAAAQNGKITDVVYDDLPLAERVLIELAINDLCEQYNAEWFADLVEQEEFEASLGEVPYSPEDDV